VDERLLLADERPLLLRVDERLLLADRFVLARPVLELRPRAERDFRLLVFRPSPALCCREPAWRDRELLFCALDRVRDEVADDFLPAPRDRVPPLERERRRCALPRDTSLLK
jgi:hypothetical protein